MRGAGQWAVGGGGVVALSLAAQIRAQNITFCICLQQGTSAGGWGQGKIVLTSAQGKQTKSKKQNKSNIKAKKWWKRGAGRGRQNEKGTVERQMRAAQQAETNTLIGVRRGCWQGLCAGGKGQGAGGRGQVSVQPPRTQLQANLCALLNSNSSQKGKYTEKNMATAQENN